MNITRILIATALTAVLVSPALATPNDGRYKKSSEAMKKAEVSWCDYLKSALDIDQKEADKRSGTKAAQPYAEEADFLWEQGTKAGCSWAQ